MFKGTQKKPPHNSSRNRSCDSCGPLLPYSPAGFYTDMHTSLPCFGGPLPGKQPSEAKQQQCGSSFPQYPPNVWEICTPCFNPWKGYVPLLSPFSTPLFLKCTLPFIWEQGEGVRHISQSVHCLSGYLLGMKWQYPTTGFIGAPLNSLKSQG